MNAPRKLKGGLTNLKGRMIGFLEVLDRIHGGKVNRWRVKCTAYNCGKVFITAHYTLIRKVPKTHCGCQLKGLPALHPKEYHSWWDAKNRCHNPNHPSYPSYGAKGITMCDKWRESFANFFADMGKAPKDHTLDRVNPFGNYELFATLPDGTSKRQCRWADDLTQARNKKNSKYVKHPKTGQPILAAELADEMGITYQKLRAIMLNKGTWYEAGNIQSST